MKIKCKIQSAELRKALTVFANDKRFKLITHGLDDPLYVWAAVNTDNRYFYFATSGSQVDADFDSVTSVSELFKALETPSPLTEIERKMLNDWLLAIFFSDGSIRLGNVSCDGVGCLSLSRSEVCELITRYEAINP